MSGLHTEQATHTESKPCRAVAEAHLTALLDDQQPASLQPATRGDYLAMMSAAIDNLGLNLEGGL